MTKWHEIMMVIAFQAIYIYYYPNASEKGLKEG
jgi:hypothetical protein